MKADPKRGIFIDLDGTLADSLSVLRLAYDRFLEGVGQAGSDEEFQSLNGPTLAEIVVLLRARYALPEEPEVLLSRYGGLIDEAYLDAAPSPGSWQLVRQAHESGWHVGVVTSNTRVRARAWLERWDFLALVDDLVAGEEVARGKPAPDLYLRALERSGCATASSLAIEDSLRGVQSAVTAGLKTFAYDPRGDDRGGWPLEALVISSFSSVSRHLNP